MASVRLRLDEEVAERTFSDGQVRWVQQQRFSLELPWYVSETGEKADLRDLYSECLQRHPPRRARPG